MISYKKKEEQLNALPYKIIIPRVRENVTLATLIYDILQSPTNTYIIENGVQKKQETGEYRSREDIYLIAKNIFPNVTFKDITNMLEIPAICRWYCTDIRRRVHKHDRWSYTSNALMNQLIEREKKIFGGKNAK